MSNDDTREVKDAATEAAQHVVDDVTSWQYSAEEGTVSEELDNGFGEADVEVDAAEKERLVDEIREAEGRGAPMVREADAAE